MKTKLSKIVFCVFSVLSLSSCVGEEPDDLAYVTALGIDKSENGYYYSIQFAQPTQISGGAAEEGGSVGRIVDNIVVEAPTLYSAINIANTIISKNLSLSHSKLIVISEEIAREGTEDVCDVIIRNNDINDNVYLAVTENAGKYIEAVDPAIELNPVKYYQLTLESKNGSAIPQNTAYDFYSVQTSQTKDGVLPLAGVADAPDTEKENEISENKSWRLARVNEDAFEYGTRNYIAGQTGKKLKNKSEIIGAAVFKNTQYVGKIGSTETEIYNILTAQFKTMNISVQMDDNERPVTLRLMQKTHPKYVIDRDTKTADIYIKLKGELVFEPHRDKYTAAQIGQAASEAIDAAAVELIGKVYGEMDADILGIRGKIKKQLPTISEYEELCRYFRAADWTVIPHTNLAVTGTGTVP